MTASAITVERTSTVRRDIILDRPSRRNALSKRLVDELLDAIDGALRDHVRVVVLRSSSPVFCSGFDLDDLQTETDEHLLWRFARIGLLLERIAEAPLTTVAVLEGPAVGAGADLALACDHRLGTNNASFRFPGAGFGVVLGVQRLAELVGTSTALSLVGTGKPLEAEDAQTLGLLSIKADPHAVEAAISGLVSGVSRLPAHTLSQLAAAARPSGEGKALADLVRSLVDRPGIRERIMSFAAGNQKPLK